MNKNKEEKVADNLLQDINTVIYELGNTLKSEREVW